MKKIHHLAILPFLVVSMLASCNKSDDETTSNNDAAQYADLSIDNIHEPAIVIINQYGAALISIKDEASLDAANARFDELKKDTDAFIAAASKLEKPPIDQVQAVSSKYNDRVEQGLSKDFHNSRKHLRQFTEKNPDLEPKVSALTSRFFKESGPIKNLFDADGALSYPLDALIEQSKKSGGE